MKTLRVLILLYYMIIANAHRDTISSGKQHSVSHHLDGIQKLAFKESVAQPQSQPQPQKPQPQPQPQAQAQALSQSLKSQPQSQKSQPQKLQPQSASPSASPAVRDAAENQSRVFHVTSYGADPNGKNVSTDAILKAIAEATQDPGNGFLYKDIVNLGGARIDLDGGNYKINRPIRLPVPGRGNLMIHGGTLFATPDFPPDAFLIELSDVPATKLDYNYEYVTFKDLMLDSRMRGGGINVMKSLRTGIDNCYITGFATYGILVQGGHETYIRNSFLGQHITAGGDPGEKNFMGTAISLQSNDNAVTDVVIFSAATGILVGGESNTLSGVHCYNKATGFGGTGVYLKLAGLTQTRIINSYFDFTGVVAEDPVQLHISSSFFLGDGFVLLKSINGTARGVNIVDNMFTGTNKGVNIVQLDEAKKPFTDVDQVSVERNNVVGMLVKTTAATRTDTGNNAPNTTWTVDLNPDLLFPNRIKSVRYSFLADGDAFPIHALRNTTGNKVVVQSNMPVKANVTVFAEQ